MKSPDKPAGPPERSNGPIGSLLLRLLIAFLLLAVLPLAAVGFYLNYQLGEMRQSVNRAATTYERRAQSVAADVADFLRECEADLATVAELPREDQAYLKFARGHERDVWVRGGTNEAITEERRKIPIYKELSFIDPKGREQILVLGDELAPKAELRDVSQPANTTYRSER
ncbi:MAG: hypothetical protein JRF63_14080, partial [Deltaproteobacteria bacterium]|nr:hypothetical protein [Deltaproteobacteria bacterium]